MNTLSDPLMFRMLQAAVGEVLAKPLAFDWTIQGLGMLRTYFGGNDGARSFRLNVWDKRARCVPPASAMHTHPWDFRSLVLAGELRNRRFVEVTLGEVVHAPGTLYNYVTILCGLNAGMDGPQGTIRLARCEPEKYFAGQTYQQDADEIHATDFVDGTVTLNERHRQRDGEHARVFFTTDQSWLDAKPRVPTEAEVIAICKTAAEKLRAEM